jgi:hypothetical protein
METPEPEEKKDELDLEEGSVKITLKDIYVMFYILLRQSQNLKPGSKMSFPLGVFKTVPKKISVSFERKHGRLFAWIPEKRKRKKAEKSKLYLPGRRIINSSPN